MPFATTMLSKKICIFIGGKCNFECKHCLIDKYDTKIAPTKTDLARIVNQINKYNFKKILFVGGEPTFYIRDINKILCSLNNLKTKCIKITTNGYFAKTIRSAQNIISSFIQLNEVQLSYDIFHNEFLPRKNIKNLYIVCKKAKKRFSVIFTLRSPIDLKLIKEIRKIGNFPIGIQKVLPIGNAVKNNVYYQHPSFNKKVLLKKCPGIKEIVYICGNGFSNCCSTIFYNKIINGIFHNSIEEHIKSRFYALMSLYNFKQLAKILNVSIQNLPSNCSSECVLCEYIFKNARKDNLLKWN